MAHVKSNPQPASLFSYFFIIFNNYICLQSQHTVFLFKLILFEHIILSSQHTVLFYKLIMMAWQMFKISNSNCQNSNTCMHMAWSPSSQSVQCTCNRDSLHISLHQCHTLSNIHLSINLPVAHTHTLSHFALGMT